MHGGKREGSGRKKGKPNLDKREFLDLISDKDVNDCIDVLRKTLKGENDKLRLDAATYLLDQKFGKARQKSDITLDGGIEIVINDFTGQ